MKITGALSVGVFLAIGVIAYLLFDKNFEDKAAWITFMLLAAFISSVINALMCVLEEISEKKRGKILTEKADEILTAKANQILTNINESDEKGLIKLTEKADEILTNINKSNEKGLIELTAKAEEILTNINNINKSNEKGLAEDTLKNILQKLFGHIETSNLQINRIKILAHTSKAMYDVFNAEAKGLKCGDINILIHNTDDKFNVGEEWGKFYNNPNNNEIRSITIRKTKKVERRSFYGMVIEFGDKHPKIGLIGFYQPKKEPPEPDKTYGIYEGYSNSILEIIDDYFDKYYNDESESISIEEFKSSEE